MKANISSLGARVCWLVAILGLAVESAHAIPYSCRVTYQHEKICRYRWYEDLAQNRCAEFQNPVEQTVAIDAESASAACTAARSIIHDAYPKSYYSTTTCRAEKILGGSRRADSHCTEKVDTGTGACTCEPAATANALVDDPSHILTTVPGASLANWPSQ